MITVELTLDQQVLLQKMLEDCIKDLNTEIIHTDRFEYKDMLKKRREVLMTLLHSVTGEQEPVR